ncbi:hypothetical protein [Lactococcus lactis]|uniref:Uncharacterized protein n=1 Tax=Lactococcus lactis subsp. lactis TaxID=1360 RepID=A0A0V8DXQ6_LACLL|nr:hypothetical protein [Lactococcus lactis]KSU18350.1 hypothetical protein M20_2304 [Lactococcus lactis subsp. lactis]MCJ7968073.1 hypothetical protein [Lactococcus lactis]
MCIEKLPNYRFNKKDRKYVLEEIIKRSEKGADSNNKRAYIEIVEDIKDNYDEVQIRHLLRSFETEKKKFTDDSILKFSTFFLAIGSFYMTTMKGLLSNVILVIIAVTVLLGIVALIIKRGIAPTGYKLNTVIFLLEEAIKLEQSPLKNDNYQEDTNETALKK